MGKKKSGPKIVRRTPNNSKKSKKASKGGSRSTLIALSLTAIFLLVVGGVISFIYVDNSVANRISGTRGGTSIYTSPFKVTKNTDISVIKTALKARGYREVTAHPASGEFYANESEVIFSPRNESPLDETRNTSYGIRIHQNMEGEIEIPPVMISPIGSDDIRDYEPVSLSRIPKHVQNAVVAVEDERFFSHLGIDPIGIARAFYRNVKAGRIVEGGSTLTQQLAKNLLLSPERALSRKIKEALAAISLEVRLTKDEILELYLNEVYLGQEGSYSIHGFAQASQTFFGKNISDISISESALLAGMIRAPSYYSPRRWLQRALIRRDTVLNKMRELNLITDAELEKAKGEKINIKPAKRKTPPAPFLVAKLKSDLAEKINLKSFAGMGLKIVSGIDPLHQQCAEHAITTSLDKLEKQFPSLKRLSGFEAALVSIEPKTGLITSWVGGRNFSKSQFERVSLAKRPIGSTVKPFLYLTALDSSLNDYKVATTITILDDRPMEIRAASTQVWRPENYDRDFRGDVTLRYALEKSLNLPAVYLTQKFGIPALVNTLKLFQVAKSVPALPSIALGSIETSLLELTSAFNAINNGGEYVYPRIYDKVVYPNGEIFIQTSEKKFRAAESAPVYVLTDIMRGVLERGTARVVRNLGFTLPAAGKTGTTNDARDSWFVGFTPDLTAGVWVGDDGNKKIGLTGGAAAAPIWAEFMKCVSPQLSGNEFQKPEDVVYVPVDSYSGLRWNSSCEGERIVEVFVKGTEPLEECGSSYRDLDSTIPPRRKRSFWEDFWG